MDQKTEKMDGLLDGVMDLTLRPVGVVQTQADPGSVNHIINNMNRRIITFVS